MSPSARVYGSLFVVRVGRHKVSRGGDLFFCPRLRLPMVPGHLRVM